MSVLGEVKSVSVYQTGDGYAQEVRRPRRKERFVARFFCNVPDFIRHHPETASSVDIPGQG